MPKTIKRHFTAPGEIYTACGQYSAIPTPAAEIASVDCGSCQRNHRFRAALDAAEDAARPLDQVVSALERRSTNHGGGLESDIEKLRRMAHPHYWPMQARTVVDGLERTWVPTREAKEAYSEVRHLLQLAMEKLASVRGRSLRLREEGSADA